MRTSHFFSLLFAGLLTTTAFAQHVESRTVSNFNGVDAGGVFEVELAQGAACSVQLDVYDAALLPKIKTEVRKGVLYIESKDLENVKGKLKVIITAPAYGKISLSGAAHGHSTTDIKSDAICIDCSGAAHLDLSLAAGSANIDASGASSLNLKGTAQKVYMDVSGSADVKAANFVTGNLDVEASGAAHLDVNATQHLDASASGASQVSYKGEPAERQIDISGAASVSKNK